MDDFQKCKLLFCDANQPDDEQIQENTSNQYNYERKHKQCSKKNTNDIEHQTSNQVYSFKFQQFRQFQHSNKQLQKNINMPTQYTQVHTQSNYFMTNPHTENFLSPMKRQNLSPCHLIYRSPSSKMMIIPNCQHKLIEEKRVFVNKISNSVKIRFNSPNQSRIGRPVSVLNKFPSQQTDNFNKCRQQNVIYQSNIVVEELFIPNFIQLQCPTRKQARETTKDPTQATDSCQSNSHSQLIYHADHRQVARQVEQSYNHKLTNQLFQKARKIQTKVNLTDFKQEIFRYNQVDKSQDKIKNNDNNYLNQQKSRYFDGQLIFQQIENKEFTKTQKTLVNCFRQESQPINSQTSSSSSLSSYSQNKNYVFLKDQIPKDSHLFVKKERVDPQQLGDNYKSKNIQSHLFQANNIMHNTTLKSIIDSQHKNQRKIVFEQTSPTNSRKQIYQRYVPGMFKHPKTILSIGSYTSESSCLDIKFMQSLGSKRGVNRLV